MNIKTGIFWLSIPLISNAQAVSSQCETGLTLTAKIDSINSRYVFIKAELLNGSTDIIRYVGWACSWPKLFFIDENSLDNATIFWRDKNVPEVFSIAPGEHVARALTFHRAKYVNKRKK